MVGVIVAVVAAVAGILLMKKRGPPKPASGSPQVPKAEETESKDRASPEPTKKD